MRKLLAEGRTDLLHDSCRTRTRRSSRPSWCAGDDGKVGFEFEPRPARGATAKAGAAATGEPPAKKVAAKKAAAKKVARRPAKWLRRKPP